MIQAKFKIKKNDVVQVITGKEKGKRGTVKKVLLDKAQVIVENVNVVVRHIRPDQRHPEGSIKKEMPISISNVALIDATTGKRGSVGFKLDEDGKKVRYFKKSGSIVG